MSIVRVEGLRKIYPNGTVGLDGLTVEIGSGEMVGILGSSGAGKTTLFRLLNGTLYPTGGQLEVLGQRLDGRLGRGDLRKLRTRLALVSQHHNVIPSLSVLNNILIGRLGQVGTARSLLSLVRPSQHERQLALEALALVSLPDRLYHRAEDLSGGQQQRVAIARAMAQGAELLLADEPIASVDMRNAGLLLDLFRRLNEELGVTVVMNLHQLDFAVRYCRRILVLKAGRLAYDGSPEDLQDFDIYGELDSPALEEPSAEPLEDWPEAALLGEAEVGELVRKRKDAN